MVVNNYIVDVLISCVEFLFRKWYITCSGYMHIGHELMDISCPPYISWACWYALSGLCNATI